MNTTSRFRSDEHGTVYGYKRQFCRCDECRAAWAAEVRRQYWKRKVKVPEDPAEIKRVLDKTEDELEAVYRKLWPLREAWAAKNPPSELPAPRHRTAKQDLVARCPRCGGRIEDESVEP